MILFVKWWAAFLCWRCFFFVGTTIAVSQDGQQDVQFLFQKCTSQQRGTESTRALKIFFDRTCGVSIDVPTSASSESPSICHLLVRMPQNKASAQVGTDNPSSNSFFFQHLCTFAFTVTHIVRVTAKGAPKTLPIPSFVHVMLPARRTPKQARRAERNARIKNPYR